MTHPAVEASTPLGPRPTKIIPWPGEARGISIALVVLTKAESTEARLAALHQIKDAPPRGWGLTEEMLAHDPLLADDEQRAQVLARAVRDADNVLVFLFADKDGKPSVTELRRACTDDELEALFNAYVAYVDERSPIDKIHTVAELEEVVEELGKGLRSPISLSSYDRNSLVRIAMRLAAKCRAPTEPSSSDFSQSSEPEENSVEISSTEEQSGVEEIT